MCKATLVRRMLRCSSALALALALLVCWSPTRVRGACSPVQPSVQEQFELSDVVARLNATAESITLPCAIQVYDEASFEYVLEDSFSSFQVLEVFKGTLTDDAVPLLLLTDVGFWPAVEGRFRDDTQGFLAFLFPRRRCLDPDEGFVDFPEDWEPTPYSMSTCVSANTPWSQLSDEDKTFLEMQAATPISATDPPTGAPMETFTKGPATPPPTEAPELPPTPPPTEAPELPPTEAPELPPTPPPTEAPVVPLTSQPTEAPVVPLTSQPTDSPVVLPTGSPTESPAALSPTGVAQFSSSQTSGSPYLRVGTALLVSVAILLLVRF